MMTGEAAEVAAREAGAGLAGPTRSYVCPARDQVFLMPACMRDWLEEGHLAWFVLDAVAELDTVALHRRPGGAPGRPPYEPEMMLALLLYAYCCGMRSSRRIEAACRTDAAFRVISGGLAPDHATIARFVVDQERALEGLFAAGLRLCAAAGLVDLSVLALDGTKVGADAALARNRDGAWIRREVARLMAATAQDEAPCAGRGGALPGAQTADGACSRVGALGPPASGAGGDRGRGRSRWPPKPSGGRRRRLLTPSKAACARAASRRAARRTRPSADRSAGHARSRGRDGGRRPSQARSVRARREAPRAAAVPHPTGQGRPATSAGRACRRPGRR